MKTPLYLPQYVRLVSLLILFLFQFLRFLDFYIFRFVCVFLVVLLTWIGFFDRMVVFPRPRSLSTGEEWRQKGENATSLVSFQKKVKFNSRSNYCSVCSVSEKRQSDSKLGSRALYSHILPLFTVPRPIRRLILLYFVFLQKLTSLNYF